MGMLELTDQLLPESDEAQPEIANIHPGILHSVFEQLPAEI